MTGFLVGWGGWTLATSVEAGLVGALVLGTDGVLRAAGRRPPARWTAAVALLALLGFAVPGVALGPASLEVAVEAGGGWPAAALGTVFAAALAVLAVAQIGGLMVGAALVGRSRIRLRRTLRRAAPVLDGAAHDALRRVARRMGVGAPRLYTTRDAGPAAVGLARPAILIPAGLVRALDTAALEMVLAHESAHVRRRDPLAAAIRTLVLAAWWFHPVAWALALRHRAAAEDACDDAVLDAGATPADYCATLLACATAATPAGARPALGSAATGIGGHPMGRRFRRLFSEGTRPRRGGAGPSRLVLAAALAAAALCLPVRFLDVRGGPAPRAVSAVPDDGIVIRNVVRDVRTTRRVID